MDQQRDTCILSTSSPYKPEQTLLSKFSFLPNTVKDWNLLPPEVINESKAAKSPVKSFVSVLKRGINC